MPISSIKVNMTEANENINDIPVSKNIDIEQLKKDDDNYVEIVAEIPVSKSKRGWNYTEKAIKDVVTNVNEGKVIGLRGHQDATKIGTEFPSISTVWTGAKYDSKNKKAFVRGIIDPSDPDLKRWVTSGLINQVSIFGEATLKKGKNKETNVTGYKTYSIDWTPPDRNGMETTVKVYKKASGEMTNIISDNLSGELDGSFEEMKEELQNSLNTYFGNLSNNDTYVWIKKTFQDSCVCEVSDTNTNYLYNVQYQENNDIITLGEVKQVKEVVTYEPVNIGEMGESNLSDKTIEKEIIKEIMPKDFKKVVGEMSSKDLEEILKKYQEQEETNKKKIHGEMVQKILKDEVQNEDLRNLILSIKSFIGEDEKAIKGEIAEVLNLDVIKKFNDTTFKAPSNNNNENDNNSKYGITWKNNK